MNALISWIMQKSSEGDTLQALKISFTNSDPKVSPLLSPNEVIKRVESATVERKTD